MRSHFLVSNTRKWISECSKTMVTVLNKTPCVAVI
uniref:Uncharacterized protein n=1 Tax=Anguilla anguilla TaxID=7936 RepID=A0A0E9UAR2_ANGAN